jgi:hypothetical protein
LAHVEASDSLDACSENWNVMLSHSDDFHRSLEMHRVKTVEVIKDDEILDPSVIQSALRNSLVHIQFSLKHFCFDKSKMPSKTFNGIIESITIIKSGLP